jgi:rubredoxin
MSQAYECDRCGELFEGRSPLHVTERRLDEDAAETGTRSDYCPSCQVKYRQFKDCELE